MSCGQNKYHVIFHKRFYMEVFPLFRTFDERQVNLSSEEGFEHLIRIPAASRDADLRVRPPKASHEPWQEVLTDGLGSSQSEFACMLSKCLGHRGEGFVGELFHPLCKRQECPSAGCERDMATAAIEKRYTEFIFKRLDLLRNCGLRK